MPIQVWNVNIRGEHHTVEVMWSQWSNTGHISVDGHVADRWGRTLNLAHRTVPVGKHDGYIRWPGSFIRPPDLFVDGELVT